VVPGVGIVDELGEGVVGDGLALGVEDAQGGLGEGGGDPGDAGGHGGIAAAVADLERPIRLLPPGPGGVARPAAVVAAGGEAAGEGGEGLLEAEAGQGQGIHECPPQLRRGASMATAPLTQSTWSSWAPSGKASASATKSGTQAPRTRVTRPASAFAIQGW